MAAESSNKRQPIVPMDGGRKFRRMAGEISHNGGRKFRQMAGEISHNGGRKFRQMVVESSNERQPKVPMNGNWKFRQMAAEISDDPKTHLASNTIIFTPRKLLQCNLYLQDWEFSMLNYNKNYDDSLIWFSLELHLFIKI